MFAEKITVLNKPAEGRPAPRSGIIKGGDFSFPPRFSKKKETRARDRTLGVYPLRVALYLLVGEGVGGCWQAFREAFRHESGDGNRI